ncbi:J domain-containing protein [Pseudomonas syringae]|uniref:Molecular chaperone DnaJ n=1 Tax=Pseudomonas syringae TaxID=317 RepID=A0A085VPQ1_PSESX|nr:DnaJ domain-containing protein [Pseudomonas syringae]KFE57414.1 molecular chaperone DnaJ [Pseudomonas syringae]
MPKTRTYYDELNVSRDASADEIKHAFRKLAQQLHPDRNHTANSSDLMAVVNAAHDVLANPQKRAEYDATLIREAQLARQAAAQRRQAGPPRGPAQPSAKPQARASARQQNKKTKPPKRGSSLRWAAVFLVACGAGAWMGYDRDASKAAVVPPLAQEQPIVVQPPVAPVPTPAPTPAPAQLPVSGPVKIVEPGETECVPPPLDPLGAPWPVAASYIAGMPMLRDGGWSEITVDNTGGDKPVYAKVTDASGKRDYRHAYIPARSRFTFGRMDVGYYQLKYKMLDTGCAYASSRIRLEESLVGDRIKSSMYKLTLRKLANGSSQFSNVRSEEF